MMRARQGGRYDRAERPNGTAHKTDKVSRALQKVVPRRLKAKTNLRDMLIWQPRENFLYHRCNRLNSLMIAHPLRSSGSYSGGSADSGSVPTSRVSFGFLLGGHLFWMTVMSVYA